jgi:hypothetical protein
MHPELAARGRDDRRRQAVVVGVGVGADEQLDVVQPEGGLRERPLQLRQLSLAADAGVEEDDALLAGDGPGVAVRDPRPGQRQAQAPDTRQDPVRARLGASSLAHDTNLPTALGRPHRGQARVSHSSRR